MNPYYKTRHMDSEIDIMISPSGTFDGSSVDGSPVQEKLTEEALRSLCDEKEVYILLDADHKSESPDRRDTRAMGWVKRLFMKGSELWGRIRFTQRGMKSIEDGEYKYVSPVFDLNENSEPVALRSVALTNTPALPQSPFVLNQISKESTMEEEKKTEQTEDVQNAEPVEVEVEKPSCESDDERKMELVYNACKKALNECIQSLKDEVMNSCKAKNEAPPEVKKEEIIKEAALNQKPKALVEEWRNKTGQAFWPWLEQNKQNLK